MPIPLELLLYSKMVLGHYSVHGIVVLFREWNKTTIPVNGIVNYSDRIIDNPIYGIIDLFHKWNSCLIP